MVKNPLHVELSKKNSKLPNENSELFETFTGLKQYIRVLQVENAIKYTKRLIFEKRPKIIKITPHVALSK